MKNATLVRGMIRLSLSYYEINFYQFLVASYFGKCCQGENLDAHFHEFFKLGVKMWKREKV